MPTHARTTVKPVAVRAMTRTLCVAISLAALGCAPAVHVRTTTAPDAELAIRHTFRILMTPAAPGVQLQAYDPMLDNSITSRAIRDNIRAALEAKGYSVNTVNPDFTVAYYASAQPKWNVSTWDYGYSWRGYPREYTEVNEFEQGTVILDVVDPVNKELLWRGRGVAAVSSDPDVYKKELAKAVDDIMKKYPHARLATPTP